MPQNQKQTLEEFAANILRNFTGTEPSLGEVLSLKEDLAYILTTKYNISQGNL